MSKLTSSRQPWNTLKAPRPIRQSWRSERSKKISPVKKIISQIPSRSSVFSISKELTGSNESSQYQAEVTYKSCITDQPGKIKIEVGLREDILRDPQKGKAKTILLNPFTGTEVVSPINVICLDILESLAEKVRAALSRRHPAIRDLYDIWYAIEKNLISSNDEVFRSLVGEKIAIPGNRLMLLTEERLKIFRRQIETDLRPVLSEENFQSFDFEGALDLVRQVIPRLS